MSGEPKQPELRQGLDGSRWVNYRPTAEEVAAWFEESFVIDPALKHSDYVGGITLIPTISRARYVTGFSDRGLPIIAEAEELTYNPYPRVDVRINYFWSMVAAHPEWLAVVESVDLPRIPIDFAHTEEEDEGPVDEHGQRTRGRIHRTLRTPGAMTAMVYQLPTGFSVMSVPVGQGYSHFLCQTTRVAIYDREEVTEQSGKTIAEKLEGVAPLRSGCGTKQVPLLLGRTTPYADPSSTMRAETGALGRALGFAGIFVISGAGLATVEDILEAQAQQGASAPAQTMPANQGPPAPEQAPVRTGAERQHDDEAQLQARAVKLWQQLHEEHPGKAEEFIAWMRERKLQSLTAVSGAALRGMVKKLERLSDEAQQADTPAPVSDDVSGG
jgi:hypothetical protein